MDSPRNIFAIYTSQDNDLAQDLLRRLKELKGDLNAIIWHDDPIHPGQEWKPKDKLRLDQADMVLFLVSNTFMHSEFVKQIEFKNVIDRYKEGKSTVIPVLLDDCPWNIDFNSDDYNFSFTELQVLPVSKRPVRDWGSIDQVLDDVTDQIKRIVKPVTESEDSVIPRENLEEEPPANTLQEEQIAIDFSEENKTKKRIEEQNRLEEEREAKKRVEAENKLEQEIEAKRKAALDLKLKEEAAAKKRIEEEKKLQEEAEAKNMALEKKRLREKEEIEKKARQQRKLEAEEEAKKSSVIERKKRAVHRSDLGSEQKGKEKIKNTNTKKGIRTALAFVVLAVIGVWAFSLFNKGPETPARTVPEIKAPVIEDSAAEDEPNVELEKQEVPFVKLAVGDTHEGGLVFTVDQSGKSGKIAHLEDAGPMPWEGAMNIHKQLGEGWRLPTLDELRIMYNTIGQGAANNGEFTDELYWSATPYDAHQARLLKFRNGNSSYHYNKAAAHRKFLVRAVRDFSR